MRISNLDNFWSWDSKSLMITKELEIGAFGKREVMSKLTSRLFDYGVLIESKLMNLKLVKSLFLYSFLKTGWIYVEFVSFW